MRRRRRNRCRADSGLMNGVALAHIVGCRSIIGRSASGFRRLLRQPSLLQFAYGIGHIAHCVGERRHVHANAGLGPMNDRAKYDTAVVGRGRLRLLVHVTLIAIDGRLVRRLRFARCRAGIRRHSRLEISQ
ncbi:hypothetical protein WS62_29820 [Burkholderia sp. ABCPW 14]|nr:hypothetical protein WS62_29820 [Burkholderia sp. ABCPW 14]